jgi:GNAT superfamily N-acetyltransferase
MACASQYLIEKAGLKSRSREYTTNCFADPQLMEQWAREGQLSIVRSPGALLLLRRGDRVLHLFHSASDHVSLGNALQQLVRLALNEPVSADLVGRSTEIETLKGTYSRCGFQPYKCLLRMTRIGPLNAPPAVSETKVLSADRGQTAGVRKFLSQLLDPCSEQIPEMSDLERAAEQGQILIVREGRELGGVLIFKTVGQSSTLRYWFVDPRMRGKRIGALLMRSFLHRVSQCHRITLWVFADNEDAIMKYRHYEFNNDGLQDWIMLKTPTGVIE